MNTVQQSFHFHNDQRCLSPMVIFPCFQLEARVSVS
jgi:hypothetical protein